MGRRERDISGKRYGRLTAIIRTEDGNGKRIRWRCVCDCGRETMVFKCNLLAGRTRSCGCLREESVRERNYGRSALGHEEHEGEE